MIQFTRTRITAWLLACALPGCGQAHDAEGTAPAIGQVQQAYIYGADDRLDVHEIDAQVTAAEAAVMKNVARATAILATSASTTCPADRTRPCTLNRSIPVNEGDESHPKLCAGQRFADQAMLDGSLCSAALVGQNLVVTAGGCISNSQLFSGDCSNLRIIFGYETDASGASPNSIRQEDVYTCSAILARSVFPAHTKLLGAMNDIGAGASNYTVIQLDRPVLGRTPLEIRRSGSVSTAQPVSVAGHSHGKPLKVAKTVPVDGPTGVDIFDPHTYFAAPLEATLGMLGAPVFSPADGHLEGIVAGLPGNDVVHDPNNPCFNYQSVTADPLQYPHPVVTRTTRQQPTCLGTCRGFNPGLAEAIPPLAPTTTIIKNGAAMPDTDGDGLPDVWETDGADTDGDGNVDVDLAAYGAKPNHKDVFLHVDWMVRPATANLGAVSFAPDTEVVNLLVQAFEDAPVSNPDSIPGIHLHIDAGPASVNWATGTAKPWQGTQAAAQVPHSEFLVTACPGDEECSKKLVAAELQNQMNRAGGFHDSGRQGVFYYALAADKPYANSGLLGHSRGFNLITAIGAWEDGSETVDGVAMLRRDVHKSASNPTGDDRFYRAGNLMHELGHSLGLDHTGNYPSGGTFPAHEHNAKPNYQSVMNNTAYGPRWGLVRTQDADKLRRIDYSQEDLPVLDEGVLAPADPKSGLCEQACVEDLLGIHMNWHCGDHDSKGNALPTALADEVIMTSSGVGAVFFDNFSGARNWDCSGITVSGTSFVQDPNELPASMPIKHSINSGMNINLLRGYDDWHNLDFNGMRQSRGCSFQLPGDLIVVPVRDISDQCDDTLVSDATPAPELTKAFLEKPHAVISASTTRGFAPLQVALSGGASYDKQTGISAYSWRFGDGTSSGAGPSVTHTYSAPGIYEALLVVTDANGNRSDQYIRRRIIVDGKLPHAWSGFRGSPTHSGRSPFVGPHASSPVLTVNVANLDIRSSAAIGADSTIYFGSDDNKLYAVNPDGTVKWTFHTLGDVKSSPALSGDGLVYVGSDDDRLYALNAQTGALVCSRNLGLRDVASSPVIGANGTVYIGSNDGRLYALDPHDCHTLWTVQTGGDVTSSPAVGSNGVVYVGSNDNRVYAVNPNGTVLWTRLTAGDVSSSPALSDDGTKLFVGSDDHNLWALSTATGAVIWKKDLGADVESSPAIGLDGTVYVGAEDGDFFALNPTTGAVIWTKDLGLTMASSAAIGVDGIIYVGSNDNLLHGRVYALSGATGATIWSYQTGPELSASPAIGRDGRLVVGSDETLYVFGG